MKFHPRNTVLWLGLLFFPGLPAWSDGFIRIGAAQTAGRNQSPLGPRNIQGCFLGGFFVLFVVHSSGRGKMRAHEMTRTLVPVASLSHHKGLEEHAGIGMRMKIIPISYMEDKDFNLIGHINKVRNPAGLHPSRRDPQPPWFLHNKSEGIAMKKLFYLLAAVIFTSFFCFSAMAADEGTFSVDPTTNGGKKWRIAYYEGGEYLNYQQVLTATVRALMQLGWLQTKEIPPQKGEQTKQLWDWLATQTKSKYLEFVPDGHYSAHWDDKIRTKTAAQLIDRLNSKHDIDLIIALGTWAGKDLANSKHHVPTVILSTSDPISAGIIKSRNDSGFRHIHAQVDPDRWERQIRLFHEIINFKKLGVAYENSVSGRSYAAIDMVEKVAKERGFVVTRCFTKSDIADTKEAANSVKACFEKLSSATDAIYVTEQGGINNSSIPALVKVVNTHHIPTFAQYGSEMVKYGFLVSTSTAGYRYVGEFHAKTIAKIFNGAAPNELDQVFEEPPKIAINLKTAEIIGYDPPLVILGAADEIFREIVTPPAPVQ